MTSSDKPLTSTATDTSTTESVFEIVFDQNCIPLNPLRALQDYRNQIDCLIALRQDIRDEINSYAQREKAVFSQLVALRDQEQPTTVSSTPLMLDEECFHSDAAQVLTRNQLLQQKRCLKDKGQQAVEALKRWKVRKEEAFRQLIGFRNMDLTTSSTTSYSR